MKLVAVNGRKYAAAMLDAAIVAAHANKRPIELLIESGDYYQVLWRGVLRRAALAAPETHRGSRGRAQ